MTPTPAPAPQPVAGPRYYRGCGLYEWPPRPTEPVSFAETESLAAFYVAYHDPAGRMVRLDKVGLVRVSRQPVSLPPPGLPAGTTVYYAVVSPPDGDPHPGDRLDYAATEGLAEYFAGPVDATGCVSTLSRLRRETVFTETFAYGPAGQLRERPGPNGLPVPSDRAGAEPFAGSLADRPTS